MAEFLQDTLRGRGLEEQPFFDPARVRGLLDHLPELGPEARAAVDPSLMVIVGLVRFSVLLKADRL